MSKSSIAANALVYAAEKVCELYGVRYTREQSRVVTVVGAAGRMRPMFFGKWVDDAGETHNCGRADLLARPRVRRGLDEDSTSVPLWIECKSGKGRLSPDQIAFKNWVETNGDSYLLLHDDVQPLVDWFVAHGVKKEPRRIIHSAKPMDTAALDELPCRHCEKPKAEHIGKIVACAGKMGKCWSPSLKVKA